MPKGKITQKRVVYKNVTLHDLDKPKYTHQYITDRVINRIDRNKAEVIKSALIVENADLLGMKELIYLKNTIESQLIPLIILISRKELEGIQAFKVGLSKIQKEQVRNIIIQRADFERGALKEEIINRLVLEAENNNLKYALNILSILGMDSRLSSK